MIAHGRLTYGQSLGLSSDPQRRHRHQRLHQHRQQSRAVQGRVPAAPRLLVRPRRRPAARDLRRRRPRLRPHAVRLPAARADQVRARHHGGPLQHRRSSLHASAASTASTWDPAYAQRSRRAAGAAQRHGGRGQPHQQRPQGALLRSVQPRHAQPPRRLEHQRRRSRASSARTASCSRWAIATRTAISGRTARSPGAIRRRARGRAAHRRQRHRDEEHAGAAVGGEAVHRGIRWGTTFAYTYTDAKQNRDINEHYAFDASSINEYPFILSNAVAEASRGGHGLVRGAVGSHAGRQAHLGDADSAQRRSPASRRRATFANGAPCTPFALRRRAQRRVTSRSTCRSRRTSSSATWARCTCASTSLNVTNEHNLVDYIDVTRHRTD